jgi:hypothetical protein
VRAGAGMVLRVSLSAVVGMASCSRPARAQDLGWRSTLEANASTLFGASSQTLTSAALTFVHAGTRLSVDAGVRFRYGESEDEDQVKFVNARGWAATAAVDGAPTGRFSPFLSAAAEASLEKRIANRQSVGAGAKWVFAKSNTGLASISAAVVGERTIALRDSAASEPSGVRVARWSWRVAVEQRVADRLSLTHVSVYGPQFNAPAQYTITSKSVASYAISQAVGLTLTLSDNYDSQARLRGAPANNDGSLLFGVRGTF